MRFTSIALAEVRAELHCLLNSSALQQSENLCDLLQYVVERTLSGRSDEIKEYALGTDVFHRGSSFDPHTDTIVRVQARRLRSKLDDYYSGEGAGARIVIAIPKGRYVPEFTRRQDIPTAVAPALRGPFGIVSFRASSLLLALGIGLALAFWLWSRATPSPVVSVTPLTTYLGFERCPSFAPDGERIAFSWDGEKQSNFDIYVKQVGVADPLRLTSDPRPDISPAWSPDGRTIAFLRLNSLDKADILLAPSLTGSPVQRLAEVAAPAQDYLALRHLSWSRDNRWLVVSDAKSSDSIKGLYLVSVETGERRRLTYPSAAYDDSEPALSPDMKQLAFARYSGAAASEVYLLNLTAELYPSGDPKQLTFYHRQTGSPVWTPNGRALLFTRNGTSGISSLWRMTISGHRATEPLPIPADKSPSIALSPQGNRLAYAQESYESDIWGIELPTSFKVADQDLKPKLWIGAQAEQEIPQFSPDGRYIAFESTRSGDGEIWVADHDGSHQRQITNIHSALAGFPRWSPDGKKIVFHARLDTYANLFIVDFSSGQTTRLTDEPGCDDYTPSWSNDGAWIYFGSRRSGGIQVWKIPAKGGRAIQVTRYGGWAPFQSADGRYLFYGTRNRPGLWRIPIAGGEQEQVLPEIAGWNSAYAPAKRGIYFISPVNGNKAGTLAFFSFATKRITSLATLSRPLGLGLAVSPDERLVLYSQVDHVGSDLMLIENYSDGN
jgi:Tol biopolymer transport system component